MPILGRAACLVLLASILGAHSRLPPVVADPHQPQAPQPSGWVGLRVDEVMPDFAAAVGLDRATGARITLVVPAGPAALSGLRPDDVVLEADGTPIEAAVVLPKLARSKRPGESLHLKVWRERRVVELVLTLGTVPDSTAASTQTATDGCTASVCPPCAETQVLFGKSPDKPCTECLRTRSADISACIQSRLGQGQAAPPLVAPATASTQPSAAESASPASAPATPVALAIASLAVRPDPVPSGSRFTIDFSYTAPPASRVEFTFAISAAGRDLFTSDPETLESGDGTAKDHTCSMQASTPGTYRVRVRLAHGDQAIERSATLTVTAK